MITTDVSHLEIVCKMHTATSALLQTPSLLLFPHFAAQLCAHFASHALLTHGFWEGALHFIAHLSKQEVEKRTAFC